MSSNPAKGPLIDAEPTRAHCRHLMSEGATVEGIARAAGISFAIVSNLLYSRIPQRKIRHANAVAIRGVQPEQATGAIVDATGTQRRLQALMAIGWPLYRIAPRAGIHPSYISNILRATTLYRLTADQVAAVYEELWDLDPVKHGVNAQMASRIRNLARKNGWPPPAMWDDEAIDDPTQGPAEASGTEMNRDELAEYRRQEIAHLASFNVPEHEIAARLGMSPHYVHDLIRDRLSTAA